MIQASVQRILEGGELTQEEISGTVREMAEGHATDAQMAAFLVALRQRGETPREIATFASTLREYSVRIRPRVSGRLVDTCGTGGDRVKTFNVSTISAFVAAGAGAFVAKHGNRAVTSSCGSADLLERLGLRLETPPPLVERAIEEVGVGFLFAPLFHPAMKRVAPVRKELGVRTVFNLMGPLINPAEADAQLLGVYSPELVEKVAEVLLLLGAEEAMVVHGREGMDEISVFGKTRVSWLRRGHVETMDIRPEDFGVTPKPRVTEQVDGPDQAARIALRILRRERADSAMTEMVVVNSAAALVVAGLAADFRDGAEKARESLDSGAALKKLEELVKSTGGDISRVEANAAS
ncbi:MAG: anthranilate phosphoribosyltransferase [Nitrososphaerota archaeon]|nr:anthranilate phosphoribosyltransferase [Nitrososphaerota archaeon]